MSTPPQKATYAITGAISTIIAILLIASAGIKGFNGTGGSDTQLLQLLTYLMIPVIIGGTLSIITSLRPNPNTALISGILMTPSSLFLIPLTPLFGGPILISGFIAMSMSRSIPKK